MDSSGFRSFLGFAFGTERVKGHKRIVAKSVHSQHLFSESEKELLQHLVEMGQDFSIHHYSSRTFSPFNKNNKFFFTKVLGLGRLFTCDSLLQDKLPKLDLLSFFTFIFYFFQFSPRYYPGSRCPNAERERETAKGKTRSKEKGLGH